MAGSSAAPPGDAQSVPDPRAVTNGAGLGISVAVAEWTTVDDASLTWAAFEDITFENLLVLFNIQLNGVLVPARPAAEGARPSEAAALASARATATRCARSTARCCRWATRGWTACSLTSTCSRSSLPTMLDPTPSQRRRRCTPSSARRRLAALTSRHCTYRGDLAHLRRRQLRARAPNAVVGALARRPQLRPPGCSSTSRGSRRRASTPSRPAASSRPCTRGSMRRGTT
mmetsp:Transcript_34732/g.81925  ORF Transcript_34732/g.81925 Transcript_34732/m.81925 type:complete len:230 (-) Transcript_34732:468-1157(-)